MTLPAIVHRKAKNTEKTMSLSPAAADPPKQKDQRGTDLPQYKDQVSPVGAGPPSHDDDDRRGKDLPQYKD
jgi:hypothetical protein